jgi:hypothetical protein
VTNIVEAAIGDVGDLHLTLDDGFISLLRNILYVPFLRRNLILVPRLDDENIHYHFGDRKCIIQVNNNGPRNLQRHVLFAFSM